MRQLNLMMSFVLLLVLVLLSRIRNKQLSLFVGLLGSLIRVHLRLRTNEYLIVCDLFVLIKRRLDIFSEQVVVLLHLGKLLQVG